jgi:hypothetical protein
MGMVNFSLSSPVTYLWFMPAAAKVQMDAAATLGPRTVEGEDGVGFKKRYGVSFCRMKLLVFSAGFGVMKVRG